MLVPVPGGEAQAADCARVAQQQQVKYHYDARVAAICMFQP